MRKTEINFRFNLLMQICSKEGFVIIYSISLQLYFIGGNIMKEKYCYESVNDEIARHDVLLFISLLLFIFALIKRESVSNKVFFTLISISILMFVCWIGFFDY